MNKDKKLLLAIILILLSNLGWLLPITLIAWSPFKMELKVVLSAILIVWGHICYNLGLIVAGSKIIALLKRKKINLISIISQIRLFFFILFVRFRYKLLDRKRPQ